MPTSSTSDFVKKRLCQVLSPVATKVHAVTQIHSRLQAANETLLDYIQQLTDLVIHATGVDPTSVICQVTIIHFIRHLFNKEKEASFWHKEYSDFKTCDPSSGIRDQIKKYEGLNHDDQSIMKASAVPHSELAVQGK